jgi:hypothetical protein
MLFYILQKKTSTKVAYSSKIYYLTKLEERTESVASVATTSDIRTAAILCYWW